VLGTSKVAQHALPPFPFGCARWYALGFLGRCSAVVSIKILGPAVLLTHWGR
jgi:hypothetical protein